MKSIFTNQIIRFDLTEDLQKVVKLTLHSVEKREIHCHAIFFSSNQFRLKFFSKTLISRIFSEKMVHSTAVHSVEITEILSHAFL